MKNFLLLLIVTFFSYGQTQTEINKILSELSNEMNKNCPMVIDECSTMMSTMGGMGMVVYNISVDTKCLEKLMEVLSWDSYKSSWEINQNTVIKNSFCSNPSFQTFRDFGIKVSWVYSDLNGIYIAKIDASDEDCK